MGIRESYRLNKEIMSIHSEGNRRTPIMLPPGAVVTIENGPLDGLRMVDVVWDGKTVMLFTVDLREGATMVSGLTAKA